MGKNYLTINKKVVRRIQNGSGERDETHVTASYHRLQRGMLRRVRAPRRIAGWGSPTQTTHALNNRGGLHHHLHQPFK